MSGAGARSRSVSSSSSGHRRGHGTLPHVFVAPPALAADANGGELAQRWDDEQPLGTPTDPAAQTHGPGGGASSFVFPPATAMVLVGRNGRAAGYRGRLYCGLFNGTEVPEQLPPWVVDVVWNLRSPPEELCGSRNMLFSLVRCPSEMCLPMLQTPYCVAAPRTHIRRVMSYLFRALDFDWTAPAKMTTRRSGSAASLMYRLGRCCTVPGARSRPSSADWSGAEDGSPESNGRRSSSSSSNSGRRRSSSNRTPALYGQVSGSSGQRRSFGLRRGEDEANAPPSGATGRIRIDGSPPPLRSVPAHAAGKKGGLSPVGGIPPDDRCVEILCNDMIVDPDLSLATVRDFLWRKSGNELVLMYRRAKRVATPRSPAPPPPLLPGGGSHTTAMSGVDGTLAAGSDMNEDATSELNGSDGPSPRGELEGFSGIPNGQDGGGPPRE